MADKYSQRHNHPPHITHTKTHIVNAKTQNPSQIPRHTYYILGNKELFPNTHTQDTNTPPHQQITHQDLWIYELTQKGTLNCTHSYTNHP